VKRSEIQRKLARVDRAIDKAIEKSETPGAVVLAAMPREGEVLEHCSVRGLAVVKPERIPMARETVFDLASLTKPIATTTSLMLLASEGKLAVDDPVAKFLPAFADREKDGVTLRHLLTHSAGLKPWRAFHDLVRQKERKTGQYLLGTAEARELILDRVLRSAPVHEPGEAAVYGDLDFMALGAVVEAVSGERLDAFFRTRIAEPLGLRDSFFVPLALPTPESRPEGLAAAEKRRVAATEECRWRDKILWGEVHDPNAWAMGGVAGHAGLFATADDVMRFAKVMLDAWHGRSAFLPQEIARQFFARQDLPAGSDWALGWDTPVPGHSSAGQYFKQPSIGHLGFTGTSLWIDLEAGCAVVLLTNRVHLVAKKSKFGLRPIVHDLIREAFAAG
jgi:CubicO group peptidase (beta-lactamase class C family)